MYIGTGKVPGKCQNGFYYYKNVIHHGIDVAEPKRPWSVARFQKYAAKGIQEIYGRGHLPILCGGTGQWIDAIVFDQKFPQVRPDPKLRKQLEKKPAHELFRQLLELDPERAGKIDAHNPRRLIRALEIVLTTGRAIPELRQQTNFAVTWIGLRPNQNTLHKKIDQRLNQRLKQGLLAEIKSLHEQGLSWKKLESFGLEYKYGAMHLQNQLAFEDMRELLSRAIKQYAKRQMTWWKRNPNIAWQNK